MQDLWPSKAEKTEKTGEKEIVMKQILLLCLLAMLCGCASQHPGAAQSFADSATNAPALPPALPPATPAASHAVRDLMISLGVFCVGMLVLIWRLEYAPVIDKKPDSSVWTGDKQIPELTVPLGEQPAPPNKIHPTFVNTTQPVERLSQSATTRKRSNRKANKK